jgi:hypothetical protein
MQNIHPKTPTQANYRILDLIDQMVAVALLHQKEQPSDLAKLPALQICT